MTDKIIITILYVLYIALWVAVAICLHKDSRNDKGKKEMTKEELKKEAEEKASVYFNSLDIDNGNVSDTPFSAYDVFVAYKKGALEFAEPREKRIAKLEQQLSAMEKGTCDVCKVKDAEFYEKQIQIDAEQIRALQKQNGELTDKVKELEAQIEKMKCCYNCSKWYDGECEESPKSKTFFCADFKCDNWEIADD